MPNQTHSTHPFRRGTDRPLPRPPGVPFMFPPAPLDAPLVAACAEFGANERARRRLIARLPGDGSIATALRAELGRLTAERHGLVARITAAKARTLDGIKTKAAVMRMMVADLPALGDTRLGMADSLAADAVMVLA